jgi:hypothetical protein
MDREVWDQLLDGIEADVLKLRRILRQAGKSPAYSGDVDQRLVEHLQSTIEHYWNEYLKQLARPAVGDLDLSTKEPEF